MFRPKFGRNTSGRADIGMEVVGASETVRSAAESLRKGAIVTRQIRVTGSCASAGEHSACIDLVARRAIRVDPLIGAIAPLEDGPAWLDRLFSREPDLMKAILQP